MLILGFALTAFATCLLVDEWTGSLMAGLVAGSLFAFNTHTLTRLAHVQGIHIYGLPLALLALDRLIRGGTWRTAILLASWIAVLAYTSGYLVVFGFFMIAIALLVRVCEWLRATAVAATALAALVAALAITLYLSHDARARPAHGAAIEDQGISDADGHSSATHSFRPGAAGFSRTDR